MYGGIGCPDRFNEDRGGSKLRPLSLRMQDSGIARAPLEIDKKCRQILLEIEKCKKTEEKYIESSVLHDVPQIFHAKELEGELEAELDRLLTEQILCHERISSVSPKNEEEGSLEDVKTRTPRGCLACRSCRCYWAPFCDIVVLDDRKNELETELKSIQNKKGIQVIESTVPRSVIDGGDIKFTPSELIDELLREIKEIDSKRTLSMVDAELHAIYASTDESVIISSLHGFDVIFQREDAIVALESERNRRIATIASAEVISGILEW